ncbi:MAG: aminotransferase class V-fold PLP-dependent enzyme [Candidatus Lokiarchaeota archaeon]|nr:aminotransferase class V-fold PLP-dependent enzyme [Candidatus Lokiarchaeota archaeon]MBD3341127.1 aminotransferase class V-fold PLP-dependent enzyme [Candidatus Lokiarchaeota archaeon]
MNAYLDYQAAKPVDERVLDEMLPYFKEKFANPSSLHCEGDIATDILTESRLKVGNFVNAPNPTDIIFTASATESNNLAIIGAARKNKRKGNHIIISEIEHISIRNIAKYLEREDFRVSKVPVDRYGIIKLEKLKRLISEETILISIATASNEVGSLQPIDEIAKIASEHEILFHTDAVASESTVPIDIQKTPVDLLTFSSNDIYGPRGVAALYLKKGVRVNPIIIGGGQERGMRSGSENIPGIVGFAKAAEITKAEMDKESERLKSLRDKLIEGVLTQIPNSYLNGHPEKRLPNNAHFRFDYIEGESLILSLKDRDIAAATGSACSSKTLEPSHTLISMGLLHEEAHGSLLFSLGRYTKNSDIENALETLPEIVKRLRVLSPLTPPELLEQYDEVN